MGMETNAEITTLINKHIDEHKPHISLAAVSEATGIAYATLGRKTKGVGNWHATEIALIAEALRVPFVKFFPKNLTTATPAVQLEDAA